MLFPQNNLTTWKVQNVQSEVMSGISFWVGVSSKNFYSCFRNSHKCYDPQHPVAKSSIVEQHFLWRITYFSFFCSCHLFIDLISSSPPEQWAIAPYLPFQSFYWLYRPLSRSLSVDYQAKFHSCELSYVAKHRTESHLQVLLYLVIFILRIWWRIKKARKETLKKTVGRTLQLTLEII